MSMPVNKLYGLSGVKNKQEFLNYHNLNSLKQNIVKFLFYEAALKEISGKINCPVFLYKGISLKMNEYKENIDFRDMSDMDLFVEKKNLNKLKQTLKELSYKNEKDYPESYSKKIKEARVKIDLHSFLFNPARIPVREKLNGAVDLSFIFSGKTPSLFKNIYLFKPEIHFCLCSFHYIYHHAFEKLVWFIDLYFIYTANNLNPALILKAAEKLKLKKEVMFIFFLFNKIFDLKISAALNNYFYSRFLKEV